MMQRAAQLGEEAWHPLPKVPMLPNTPAYEGAVPAPIRIPIGLDKCRLLRDCVFARVEDSEPLEIRAIPRCDEETNIVGLDATALTLGECDRGTIVAVRAAMVSKVRSTKYKARKFGPIPFLVPFVDDEATSQDPMSFLEAYIKDYVSSNVSNSIILWDGRLQLMEGFAGGLERSRRNGNVIVALSKATISHHHPLYEKIKELDHAFVAILSEDRAKAAIAASLEVGGLVLKADYFPAKTHEKVAEDLARIVGNDILDSGYPETLRLAHILCKFSATEVISLRQAVLYKTSIEVRRKNDARRIIFGGLWS